MSLSNYCFVYSTVPPFKNCILPKSRKSSQNINFTSQSGDRVAICHSVRVLELPSLSEFKQRQSFFSAMKISGGQLLTMFRCEEKIGAHITSTQLIHPLVASQRLHVLPAIFATIRSLTAHKSDKSRAIETALTARESAFCGLDIEFGEQLLPQTQASPELWKRDGCELRACENICLGVEKTIATSPVCSPRAVLLGKREEKAGRGSE